MEQDKSVGPDYLMGVWVYDRDGVEVIGFFSGLAEGNVLSFEWEEPAPQGGPPLRGAGYLAFDVTGESFQGKWWTQARDRSGEWSGWRSPQSVE